MASPKANHNRNVAADVQSTNHVLQDNASLVLTLSTKEPLQHQDLQASIVMPQLIGQYSQSIPKF